MQWRWNSRIVVSQASMTSSKEVMSRRCPREGASQIPEAGSRPSLRATRSALGKLRKLIPVHR